jgi:hypothetical protein
MPGMAGIAAKLRSACRSTSSQAQRTPVLLLLVCLPLAVGASGTKSVLSEAQAKAAFLYQLLKFVQWPAGKTDSALVVCIVAGTSIDDAAATQFDGKTIGGRAIELNLIEKPSQGRACDVLFIPGSDARSMRSMLSVARPSTLTVGDSTALLALNGMVAIVLVDFRLELHLNRDSVSASPLRLSPQLLRLAKERRSK